MRVKRGFTGRRRHQSWMKLAEGYRGRRKNCFKLTKLAVQKGLQFAYRDRKAKKRDFRKLWIARINAAARLSGLTYSEFMHALKVNNIEINRKMLADLAVQDSTAFAALADRVKNAA